MISLSLTLTHFLPSVICRREYIRIEFIAITKVWVSCFIYTAFFVYVNPECYPMYVFFYSLFHFDLFNTAKALSERMRLIVCVVFV